MKDVKGIRLRSCRWEPVLRYDSKLSHRYHCAITTHLHDNDPRKHSLKTPNRKANGVKQIWKHTEGAPSTTRVMQDVYKVFEAFRIVYEAELGVVVGKTCSGVEVGRAKSYIFGYTCVNDVTALSIIDEDSTFSQWTRAKAFDTFCPFGPVIETELEVNVARVTANLNGRVRQDYSVEDLFFKPEELVSLISHDVTLEPGDIISCGTGPGALPLKAGATIDVSVEGIGTLSNIFSEE